jgi:hypothetical protein
MRLTHPAAQAAMQPGQHTQPRGAYNATQPSENDVTDPPRPLPRQKCIAFHMDPPAKPVRLR